MLPEDAVIDGRVRKATNRIITIKRIPYRTKEGPRRIAAMPSSNKVFLDPLESDWMDRNESNL